MSITVDLTPEVERELAARASKRGLSLSDYVQEIVASHAGIAPAAKTPDESSEARRKAGMCIRELRKGVSLERPHGMSLREYAHIGHRF